MITATIGQGVVFVDEHGVRRAAVVTHVFAGMAGTADGVNVVIVSDDAQRSDPYGRQIERRTSVTHLSGQPAHGYYWRHVDEHGKPTEI